MLAGTRLHKAPQVSKASVIRPTYWKALSWSVRSPEVTNPYTMAVTAQLGVNAGLMNVLWVRDFSNSVHVQRIVSSQAMCHQPAEKMIVQARMSPTSETLEAAVCTAHQPLVVTRVALTTTVRTRVTLVKTYLVVLERMNKQRLRTIALGQSEVDSGQGRLRGGFQGSHTPKQTSQASKYRTDVLTIALKACSAQVHAITCSLPDNTEISLPTHVTALRTSTIRIHIAKQTST